MKRRSKIPCAGWNRVGLGAVLALLVSCTSPKPGTDVRDAGTPTDGRVELDSGLLDTGADPQDGAFPDGATQDAAVGPDAGQDAQVGDGSFPDAAEQDAQVADGSFPDAAVQPPGQVVQHSSGGGTAGSTNYRVRVVIGTTPNGVTQSTNHRALVGAGHAQHGQ